MIKLRFYPHHFISMGITAKLILLASLMTVVSMQGSESFTIAGLRVTPERWNKEANFEKLTHYAREACKHGAKLVITPEGFLEGYVGNSGANPGVDEERYRSIGESIDGMLLNRVRSLARELKIYLLVGFAERRDGKMFNSAVIFSPEGDVTLHYSKVHNAHDEPYNTKGTAFPVADTPLGRMGALICYDRQLPETSRILAIKGAQLILVPSWGAYGEMNDVMMRTRAYENSVFLAFVHPNRCLFIDPKGNVIARDTGAGDQIVTARITLDNRVGRGPIRDRRPELYRELLDEPNK
jgi:predicted amidohydrolase